MFFCGNFREFLKYRENKLPRKYVAPLGKTSSRGGCGVGGRRAGRRTKICCGESKLLLQVKLGSMRVCCRGGMRLNRNSNNLF